MVQTLRSLRGTVGGGLFACSEEGDRYHLFGGLVVVDGLVECVGSIYIASVVRD